MSASAQLPLALARKLDVLMIDNFDSFTWNLYQQLCLLGADVTVIRNDAISPEVFPLLNINSLIISPGPGHPQTDSGISKEAIAYFQGKVPVLGVCMGLECLVDLYGGQISYAGEIMHGKVSRIRHDSRGCFKGVPQGITSTRYHSLSASHTTLPPELAITSISEESGVIMGVRHREYTLEAVQYHPESILSEGGDILMRNFLSLRGGLWETNPHSDVLDASLPPFQPDAYLKHPGLDSAAMSKSPTILEKIYSQRLNDVSLAESTPGTTLSDLQTLYNLNIGPPLTSFLRCLRNATPQRPALLAEIKRASPSKGPIALTTSPASQALKYALAGAQAISVLTEPKWFKGSLQDMLHARLSVADILDRPAILRKDFILSRYQVLESRIWGADTILLIVSMLPETLLRDLYDYSLELGMEPLVEVNNTREMEIAISLPAKVIGVNNRNLHNFEVDMETTSRLSEMVKDKNVILCALSGISTPEDVQKYLSEGVQAVLVGESLMRAPDPVTFIRHLLSDPDSVTGTSPKWRDTPTLVKICGIRSKEEALSVAEAGADMLGLMFVESSKRYIDLETAKHISIAIRKLRSSIAPSSTPAEFETGPWFGSHASYLSRSSSRPLLVGVFQDAPLSTVLHTVHHAQLDIVQLHGTEPSDWTHYIPVPVIRVFHVGKEAHLEGITRSGSHQFILLDSLRTDGANVSGGSGKPFDWDVAKSAVDRGEVEWKPATQEAPNTLVTTTEIEESRSRFQLPIILAGGLTPANVADAIAHVRPWAVDVSGGVETRDGMAKDLDKVRLFIQQAKGVSSED